MLGKMGKMKLLGVIVPESELSGAYELSTLQPNFS